jgi:choline dehydrogenase
MQSGIGPKAELRSNAIPVIQHLPGVGRNHQDHVSFGCIFESNEPPAVGNGGSETTLCWKRTRASKFHCQLEFPVQEVARTRLERGVVPRSGEYEATDQRRR